MITGLYAAVFGFMLVVLVLRVAQRRQKYRVGLGDGGIPDLTQAIRVHGNFIEIVPIMLIMMVLMEEGAIQTWVLHVFGIVAVLSRLLHAYGITKSPLISFGRKWSIFLTLSWFLIASLTLIFMYIKSSGFL